MKVGRSIAALGFTAITQFMVNAYALPPLLEQALRSSPNSVSLVIRTPSATNGIDTIRPAINVAGQCDLQRNLDDDGKQAASAIQNSIGSLDSVADIYASEYCRSVDSANIVFPTAEINSVGFLNDACFNTARNNTANNETFTALLNDNDSFKIVFAHSCNIRMILTQQLNEQCGNNGRLDPAQAAVIQSNGGQLRVLGCIGLEDWN